MLNFRGVREGLLGVVFSICFTSSNLTCSYSPLKINGWKLKFPLNATSFQKWAVSFRECKSKWRKKAATTWTSIMNLDSCMCLDLSGALAWKTWLLLIFINFTPKTSNPLAFKTKHGTTSMVFQVLWICFCFIWSFGPGVFCWFKEVVYLTVVQHIRVQVFRWAMKKWPLVGWVI